MVPPRSTEQPPAAERWAQAVARAPLVEVLVDLDAVSAFFAPDWRAVRALEHILAPDLGVQASYVLAHVDDAARLTLGALTGAADRDGWRARLLADDPDMRPPLDPAQFAPRLAEALGQRPGGCRATAVRWRPDDRCVVRYEADAIDRPVYVKSVAGGVDDLAALLCGLWQATGAPGLPRPPRPLAVWPDWSAVLIAEVQGEDLGRVAVRGARSDAVRRLTAAGRGIGAFHDAVRHPAPVRSSLEDVATLDPLARTVSLLAPEVGDRYASVVERLRIEETAAVPGRPVAGHGALRPSHVLLDGDRVGLIDVDGYRLAEAEHDIGELLAYLRWRSAKHPADTARAADAAAALLAGYREVRPLDDLRLRCRRAVSLTRLIGRRFAALDVRHWAAAEALLDDVDALLDGAP